jgi:hypothetical protein
MAERHVHGSPSIVQDELGAEMPPARALSRDHRAVPALAAAPGRRDGADPARKLPPAHS